MRRSELGLINPLVITTAVLAVLVIGLGGFSVWSFVNYMDQKDNVDVKIAAEVATAKKQQQDDDAKAFAEQEKQPTRQFAGPADLGSVTLAFPKTWSLLIESDGTNGSNYEALFQPDAVINPNIRRIAYALRVSVLEDKYEDVLRAYQERIDKLTATSITLNGQAGVRLDGMLNETIRGSIVIFKVRDKTLKLTTESPTFVSDFNDIILPSLKFNS